MMEQAIKEFQKYLVNLSTDKKDLFDVGPKKISLQICFHKIPNLINEKPILCKLPHSLFTDENTPEVCLMVKDLDKKDRDYEKTIRKYKEIIEENKLENIVKQILPLKQINLEFRHFEAKRKLCTSFDLFLADKCLHDILNQGSKLGKEFLKRRKMPIFIDVADGTDLNEKIRNVLDSTMIRLNGKGNLVDINAFLTTHSIKEAVENINKIKSELIKHLPGGEQNIKSIFIKSTDAPAVPIYVDTTTNMNEIKVKNNMTAKLIKKNKKLTVKRLKKKAGTKAKNSIKKTNKKLFATKQKSGLEKKNATTKKIKNLIN